VYFINREEGGKIQPFLTWLVTFLRNAVGRILCFTQLFPCVFAFLTLSLCGVCGEKGQVGESQCMCSACSSL